MIYFYITVPPNLYYREFDYDFIHGMMQEMKDEYKVEYKEGLDKSLKYPRQWIYTQLHTDMSKVAKMLNSRWKKQFTVCNFNPMLSSSHI